MRVESRSIAQYVGRAATGPLSTRGQRMTLHRSAMPEIGTITGAGMGAREPITDTTPTATSPPVTQPSGRACGLDHVMKIPDNILALEPDGNWYRHQNAGGDGGWVSERAYVDPLAYIGPLAAVYGEANVGPHAALMGSSRASGHAQLVDYATLRGHAIATGYAEIRDYAQATGRAVIMGEAVLRGSTTIIAGAWRESPLQLQIGPDWMFEPSPGQLQIGDQRRSVAWWSERISALVERYVDTDPHPEVIRAVIHTLRERAGLR